MLKRGAVAFFGLDPEFGYIEPAEKAIPALEMVLAAAKLAQEAIDGKS